MARAPGLPTFPFQIGQNISDEPGSWLMVLSEHLRMLHSIALNMSVAQQMREAGNIQAALGIERTIEALIARLPADWRW